MAPTPQADSARERPQSAKDVLTSASSALRQEGKSMGGGVKTTAPAARGARSQVCQVCRLEPLLFHECPECASRYCSSGCLQSWYDHSKPSRAAPFAAPVVQSEGGNHVNVQMQGSESGSGKKEVELTMKRLAGGFVMAETSDVDAEKRRRWNITSVDGWQLGTPGPGMEWRPAKGVSLTLEELGSCRSCKTQLALQEYICNSASRRPPSAQRDRKQRAVVRTSEVGTQTDIEFAETAVQAVSTTCETSTQAVAIDSCRTLQAHVAFAGAALAKLAEPSTASDQLVFLSEKAATRDCLREAMSALAEGAAAASGMSAQSNSGSGKAPTEDDMVFKVKQLEEILAKTSPSTTVAPQDLERLHTSDRVLGHKGASILHKVGSEAGSDAPRVDSWGGRILANGTIAALNRSRRSRSNLPPSGGNGASLPPADLLPQQVTTLPTDKDAEDAEQVYLQGGARQARTADAELRSDVNDAIINVASLLCCQDNAPSAADVVAAVAGAAALLPGAQSANQLTWRRLAQAERWPWLSRGKSIHPPGWQLLRSALRALASLAQVAGMPTEGPELSSALATSLEAVASLALLTDAIVADRDGDMEAIPRPSDMAPAATLAAESGAAAATAGMPSEAAAKPMASPAAAVEQPAAAGAGTGGGVFGSLLQEVSISKPVAPQQGGIGDILGSGIGGGAAEKPLFGGGGGGGGEGGKGWRRGQGHRHRGQSRHRR
mmetsp:Transcript_12664/g.29739  ORF Transcript_12664/g.29739 Transcript_12664/m.29739 type:complete len:720 (+) Transcript_12664:87-2246(+)